MGMKGSLKNRRVLRPYKGITKRFITNVLLVVAITVLILEIIICVWIRTYFYNQSISSLAVEAENGFSSFLKSGVKDNDEFLVAAKVFAESYDKKDKIECTILDMEGRKVAQSSKVQYDDSDLPKDVKRLTQGEADDQTYSGKNASGRKVIAHSKVLKDTSGKIIGIIRLSASLENIDRQIMRIILMAIGIGFTILLLVGLTGYYFIRSIITPFSEITKVARKIAEGDFTVRLCNFSNDEIGDLCTSINYMAGELSRSEQLKQDFISSISHELRTPLTAIKGWSETVKDSKDQEINEKGMRIITAEVTRLSSLVEELLDFSQIQDKGFKIKFEKVDIFAELSEAVLVYERQASKCGVELIYIEPSSIIYIIGDNNRLRQVFINIIDNAVKYSQDGGRVIVKAEIDEKDVKIIISDNGCGIPESEIPNVKEKFYKLNYTIGGSGIGLAVAEEIISGHNGTIDIESGEGEGTIVTITIPKIADEGEENE